MNFVSPRFYLGETTSNNLETIQMKYSAILCGLILASCATKTEKIVKVENSPKNGDVTIMTLDPGHFHAALVQK